MPHTVVMRRLRRSDLVRPPALLALTMVCTVVLAVRAPLSGDVRHVPLLWNVFLAWIPVGLATAVVRADLAGARARTLALGAAWLAFLPNAPYLVTDLVHVSRRSTAALLYDSLMFGAFAALGVLLGAAALWPVHRRVPERLGRRAGHLFLVAMGVLTGFGVYLGRVERWNSWSVIQDPVRLGRDIWARIADPLAHPETLVVTLGFGACFLVAYVVLVGLRPASHRAGRRAR